MNTLLVDIGNTRVKWATLRGARQGRMQAAAHENSGLALRALVRGAPRDVTRVVVVSVVDEALTRVLDAAAQPPVWRRAGIHRFHAPRVRRHQQLSRHLAPRRGSLGVRRRRARARARPNRRHRQRGYRAHHRRGHRRRPPSRRRHRSGPQDHGRKPAVRHAWHPPPCAGRDARRRGRCSPPIPRARWPRARVFAAAAFVDRALLEAQRTIARPAGARSSPAAPRPNSSATSTSPALHGPRSRAARPRGVRGRSVTHLLHSRLACVQPYSFSY